MKAANIGIGWGVGMAQSSWQQVETAREFVQQRRAAIPYGTDQIAVMLQLVDRFCPNPQFVVDLGCGDGIVARAVLDKYPAARALLLDHSEAMIEQAGSAMGPYKARCEIKPGDLAERLPGTLQASVILSGYAIHHLPDERKRSLYAEIYEGLVPGGLFVNIEHVASPTSALEELFDQHFIEHQAAHSNRPVAEVSWEYHNRPDKADNKLLSLQTQLEWLQDIGFSHVDCFFKWFELAVFGGVKPEQVPDQKP
ncbi:MAG: class I SAM-dependent methyltransferase [Armatimonadota bacterium]|nr:class I SAM-dependent methyltransferase [Armatimonadota bacterium]